MAYGKSTPAGSATLARLRKSLAAGWPSGLTVLTGDDVYHLDLGQKELLASLVPDADAEFALTILDVPKGEKLALSKVVAAARSVGMFAPRRVVLLRELMGLDGEPDGLVDYAKRPPANSFLIVRAPELDRRRKLHQALAKSGELLTFGRVEDPRKLVSEVRAIAKTRQLEIDTDAAAFLAEICGGDFYRVESELDKTRVWLGDAGKGKVNLDAVREVASGSGLLSGWEIADAVLQRDHGMGLAALRRLIASGVDPLPLLGGLAYRTRGMLKAKGMMRQGVGTQAAIRAANLWGIDSGRIARGLERYTFDELLRVPSLLLAADRDLKSRALAPRAVMENLLDELTG